VLIPECKCLGCGGAVCQHYHPDPNHPGPQPGNYTVCGFCGAIMIVADDMSVRAFTPEEAMALQHDPAAMQTLAAMVHVVHMQRAANN